MSKIIKSTGICVFCEKSYTKSGIHKHLQNHLESEEKKGEKGISFLLKIQVNPRWGQTPYFLSVWMDGGANLKKLDQFLRDIWLECCDHRSAFDNDLIPMKTKAENKFHKGLKINYEYDFGSTTELQITVVGKYNIKPPKKIVLLSRNEPLGLKCTMCESEIATQLCKVCGWQKQAFFCEACAKKHAQQCTDFNDYASMPIVNSPRMGVCGYVGGSIDTKRD